MGESAGLTRIVRVVATPPCIPLVTTPELGCILPYAINAVARCKWLKSEKLAAVTRLLHAQTMKTILLGFLISAVLYAQQQPAGTGPLTNQRIIELVHSGIRADELARIIATALSVSFDLSPSAEQAMMSAGVTEDTIRAMAAREQGVAPGTESQQGATPTYQPPPVAPGNGGQRQYWGDVFAGYSYLNVDTNGLTSRQGLNGWEASIAVGAKRIAGEAAFGGYYKSNALGSGVAVHDYSFLGGPRVTFGQGFVHALFGGDRLTGSALGFSSSQTGFAAAFGGGVQSKAFGGHWAVRTSADYVLSRHNVLGGSAVNQNNFRVSGGIVYVFGTGAY
jgi:hypothetical protein